MNDLVKRLRSCQGRDFWPPDADRICAEAADEIERQAVGQNYSEEYVRRLEASNKELLALLEQIVVECEHLKDSNDSEGETIFDKARASIKKAKNE